MPHRPKGSLWWKTRVTLDDGTTGVFACGTTSREVADDVERFVKNLHHKREWIPLRAVIEKRAELGLVYDRAKAGQLDSFLSALSAPDLSPLVAEWPAKSAKYKIQVGRLIPEGEAFPATDFTAVKIAALLDGLSVSGSTKNRYHAAVSAFGKWLRRKGVIASNIVRDIDRATPNKVVPVWLDRVQAKALIGALPMPYRAIGALMASTGVEWQVVERLTRRDIDLKKRTVHARGGKNAWRNRVVRGTELWAWRIFHDYARDFTENAPIFPGIREDTTLRIHKAAADVLGLPKTTLHGWRRTYAVQALRDGYSLQVVAHQLGHKDTTLVQKIYGQFVVEEADYRRHSKRPLSKPRAKKRASSRSA